MKFKGTASMTAVFMSLILYYFFVDVPAKQKENTEKEQSEKIIPLEAGKVVEFSIIRNGDPVTLKRNISKNWDLTRPISALGDSREVEIFLSEIENLKKTRVVENNPQDLSIYGLSSPRYKINFKFKNNSEETLLLGNESPLGGNLYFQRQSHPSVMMTAASRSLFEKSVYHFRDKTLLKFSTGAIKKIQILRENNPLEFNKNGDIWEISGAMRAQGDSGAIMNFLQSIQFSKVKEFVNENLDSLDSYGLKPPKIKLVLNDENGETQTLSLGIAKGGRGYFARINDSSNIILVGTRLSETLSQKAVTFLDKTLLVFEEKDVVEFSLRSDKETIHVVRSKNDDWNIHSPIKTDADLSTINSLLFDLKEAKVTEFIQTSMDAQKVFGLNIPHKSFHLKMEDGKIWALQFGNQTSDGQQIFANRTGESTVFSISKEVINKLFRSLYELRNKKILRFESNMVHKILIQTPKELFELNKKGEEWNLEKPKKIKTKHIGHDLIWTLKGLEFNSIISPPLTANLSGLDNPLFTISLWNNHQEKVAALKVGKPSVKEQEYIVETKNQQYRVKKKFLDSIPLSPDSFKP